MLVHQKTKRNVSSLAMIVAIKPPISKPRSFVVSSPCPELCDASQHRAQKQEKIEPPATSHIIQGKS
jgi:hypothetical protein